MSDPVKLTITLSTSQAALLKRKAAERHCSIEDLIMRAVKAYQGKATSPAEKRTSFTKAIAESTKDLKTGRYEP